jgi:polysaccharide export outer membrane protein
MYMSKQKKLFRVLVASVMVLALISCNSEKRINRDFNYFQKGLDSINSRVFVEPKLKVNDVLRIQVIAGSIRQDDAALFNLVSGGINQSNSSSAQLGGANQSGSQTQPSGAIYTIDNFGNIEMPKIGKIKASDLYIKQLTDTIQHILSSEVKNPLVVVTKIIKFKVNVLGEVKRPGVAVFQTENVNLLEAIAEAGDLTDNGKREDILVMRKMEEKYETFKLDLRNTNFINSPAFYLQDNDVIYVGANKSKLILLGRDPNSDKNLQITLQILITASALLNTYIILKRL